MAKRRLADRKDGDLALARHEVAPVSWESPLAAELVAAGAGDDAELVAAAQALMNLLDEAGSQSGKYTVHIQNSRGVQVGDHNTQHNRFDA